MVNGLETLLGAAAVTIVESLPPGSGEYQEILVRPARSSLVVINPLLQRAAIDLMLFPSRRISTPTANDGRSGVFLQDSSVQLPELEPATPDCAAFAAVPKVANAAIRETLHVKCLIFSQTSRVLMTAPYLLGTLQISGALKLSGTLRLSLLSEDFVDEKVDTTRSGNGPEIRCKSEIQVHFLIAGRHPNGRRRGSKERRRMGLASSPHVNSCPLSGRQPLHGQSDR